MADEIVYDGWLKVARRKIQDRTFDILKDYDAVAAIIVNENNDILLVKQFRPALMRETLEIPSGTMDDDRESDLDCLLRELKEETHLDFHPEEARLAVSYKPNVGFSNSLMKIYHIELPGSDCKSWTVSNDDVSEVVWLNFEELGQRISSGEIEDVKTIVAFLYLRNYAKQ